MNLAQFKDPVSHMCHAGTVVASWSLTQKVAGLSPFTVMTNILSLNSDTQISSKTEVNSYAKTNMYLTSIYHSCY